MKPPRGLSAEEAAAWERLAATVVPLRPHAAPPKAADRLPAEDAAKAAPPETARRIAPPPVRRGPREPTAGGGRSTALSVNGPGYGSDLDSHWDRRFARGGIVPDFTLDLHGHTLEQAHARLDAGLAQAKSLGARVVLVIAGKQRPVEAADRANRRGAIRAKLLDWLAAGPHGSDVAAVRPAHRRHGGEGALYLVLKRPR